MTLKNQFASDNYAGICPEVWLSLQEANQGYATSYGDDPWTAKACDAIRNFFETDYEVFFDKDLVYEFDYRCKQAGQLASWMRYLSAPWLGLLKKKAILRHAGHANACAAKLSAALSQIPGVKLVNPTEANAVFVQIPETAVATLHDKGWVFYTFIGYGHCRFMCSWATTDADIEDLVKDVSEVIL